MGCCLARCNLEDARLDGANLTNANLTEAICTRASFTPDAGDFFRPVLLHDAVRRSRGVHAPCHSTGKAHLLRAPPQYCHVPCVTSFYYGTGPTRRQLLLRGPFTSRSCTLCEHTWRGARDPTARRRLNMSSLRCSIKHPPVFSEWIASDCDCEMLFAARAEQRLQPPRRQFARELRLP